MVEIGAGISAWINLVVCVGAGLLLDSFRECDGAGFCFWRVGSKRRRAK